MKTIGKYSIRGLLGRGGMSRVFLAELPAIHRLVALKLLQPNPLLYRLITPARARAMFVNEATAISRLRHRHVVDVWDFEDTPDYVFYTMEYHATTVGTLIGETWRVEAPARPMPVDNAVDYARQVLDGLSALHSAGIVHRDIKPFNILITADDQVKICDFGLSQLRGERFQGPPTLKVGSPYYAAPEQAANPDDADARSDLYAAGVMIFRMLTGRLPELSAAPPLGRHPFPTDRWSAFFDKALDPSPAGRYQTAEEMGKALEALSDEWDAQKTGICRLSDTTDAPTERIENDSGARPPRHHPVKVLDAAKAQSLFKTTPLWAPSIYRPTRFDAIDDTLALDRSNRLLWQRSGAPHPMAWQDAHQYVAHLNSTRLGDSADWRLPTVNELITLLTHPPTDPQRWCAPAIFDRRHCNLWSCDRRSFTSAYVVRTDIGFVSWQDQLALAEVRAVSSWEK